MAVMASTVAESTSPDRKSGDAASSKAHELNGHDEVLDTNKSEAAPLVNGNRTVEGLDAPSDALDSHEPSEAQKSDVVATSQDKPEISALPTPKPEPEVKKDASPSPSPKEDVPAPDEDAVMEDSGKESQAAVPAATSPVEEPAVADLPAAASDSPSKEQAKEVAEEPAKVNGVPEEIAPESADKAPSPVQSPAPVPASSEQDVDVQQASVSQLAIDNKADEPVSAADTTAEVTMLDASDAAPSEITQTSTKVAREREEDSTDEPASKRARTESQGDAMEIDVASVPANDEGKSEETEVAETKEPEVKESEVMDTETKETEKPKGFDVASLPNWTSPDADAAVLTDHQRREFRRIVAGIKKTKAGALFKDSVEKLWPNVWESYSQMVEKPTDLTQIDHHLRDGLTKTLAEFKDEFALVYANSLTFNGADHDVTKSAWTVVGQIWSKAREVPASEPPRSRPAPKQTPSRHAEPRAASQPQPRRASIPAAASPTEKAPPPVNEAYAVPPGGVPQVRRASTQNDGDRPKRAIHPPKNKDLDYPPKTLNKKKLSPDLRFCAEVLEEVMHVKHWNVNHPFLQPVDPVALGIPTYFKVIKSPMDLGSMSQKLAESAYGSAKEFEKDMKLVFANCAKFNPPGTEVNELGKQLEALFKAEWAKKDQWMAKNIQSKAASVGGASSSHSDVEEEVEPEEEVESPETAGIAKGVEELVVRLQEETSKLNAMFLEDSPNSIMIDLQQTVVNAIQQSLLKEKTRLAQSSVKETKPAKPKPAKPAKKAAGGASKKAAGGAASKKAAGGAGNASGGSKKAAAARRVLTATEKDMIANAINDLESPNIEQAIDLIKRDTNQTENDSGELELDIDQLSAGCLLQLWDLCKKALPNFAKGHTLSTAPTSKAAAAKPGKPKKNKPMNAEEQEKRIAALRDLTELYKDGSNSQEPAQPSSATAETHAAGDSSEDSDSEEE